MADWSKVNGGGGVAPAPSGAPAVGGRSKWDFAGGGAAPDVAPGVTGPVEDVSNPTDTEDGGGWGQYVAPAAIGAGLLAGGAYLATHNSGTAGNVFKKLMALRSQSMLSGLAPVKSALGNVGAGVAASVERGSMAPIKEVMSMETLKDAVAAYKRGTPETNEAKQVTLKLFGKELPSPGRFMGALDEATQKGLQRAGLTEEEAAREVLQTPLGTNYGRAGEALDNPVMNYLIPFRRTPLNQLWEGGKAIGRGFEGDKGALRALGTYGTAGAVHGAATSDDDMPMTVPLAIAASGRYGLPYGLSALAGRYLAGASDGGNIAGNVLPVSEYGIDQGIGDPLKPFEDPAAFAALRRLTE